MTYYESPAAAPLRLDVTTTRPATEPVLRQRQYAEANDDIRTCLHNTEQSGRAHTAWIWYRGAYFKFVDEGELWREGGYGSLGAWSKSQHDIEEPQVRRYIGVAAQVSLSEIAEYEYALAGIRETAKAPHVLRAAMGQASSLGASAGRLGAARVAATRLLLDGAEVHDAEALLLYTALQEDGPVRERPPERPPSANVKARQAVTKYNEFVDAVGALLMCPGAINEKQQSALLDLIAHAADLPAVLHEKLRPRLEAAAAQAGRRGRGRGRGAATAGAAAAPDASPARPEARTAAPDTETAAAPDTETAAAPDTEAPSAAPERESSTATPERESPPAAPRASAATPPPAPPRPTERRKGRRETRAEATDRLLDELIAECAAKAERARTGAPAPWETYNGPPIEPYIPADFVEAARKAGIDIYAYLKSPESYIEPSGPTVMICAPVCDESARIDAEMERLGLSSLRAAVSSWSDLYGDPAEEPSQEPSQGPSPPP